MTPRLSLVSEQTRIRAHSEAAGQRAALEMAATLTKTGADQAGRAAALFAAASGADPGHRKIATEQALVSLRVAQTELAEVLNHFND